MKILKIHSIRIKNKNSKFKIKIKKNYVRVAITSLSHSQTNPSDHSSIPSTAASQTTDLHIIYSFLYLIAVVRFLFKIKTATTTTPAVIN